MNKTIYRFGHEHVVFDSEPFEPKFSKSLTDQSYYVPDSEHLKNLAQNVGSSSGAYDNAVVSEELLMMRKPGLDRTEIVVLANRIRDNAERVCDEVLTSAFENESKINEARATALNNQIQKVINSSGSATSSYSSDS